jgi:hypothetical protein
MDEEYEAKSERTGSHKLPFEGRAPAVKEYNFDDHGKNSVYIYIYI